CETVASSNNSKLVSKIVKPISHRRISISLRQLLKIVKPEVCQELINAIANPDIPQRNHIPCKIKRKKKILNDTASESSFLSGSDSESSSS
ncbi:1786_t:CDS:1, partial [Gigaspora rosea]